MSSISAYILLEVPCSIRGSGVSSIKLRVLQFIEESFLSPLV